MSVAPSKPTTNVLTNPHVIAVLEAIPDREDLKQLAGDVHVTSAQLEEIREQISKARDLLSRVDITSKLSAQEQAAIAQAQLVERNAVTTIAGPAAEAFTALHRWTAAVSAALEEVANAEADAINARRPEIDTYLRRENNSRDEASATQARAEFKRLAALNVPHAEKRNRAIEAMTLIQAAFTRSTGQEWQAGRNFDTGCARFVAQQTRWAVAQVQAQAA